MVFVISRRSIKKKFFRKQTLKYLMIFTLIIAGMALYQLLFDVSTAVKVYILVIAGIVILISLVFDILSWKDVINNFK